MLRSIHSSLRKRVGIGLVALSSGLVVGSGCSNDFTLALLDAASIGADALAQGAIEILFEGLFPTPRV